MGFEEFSAPPGSELALPPLFGGHILESELETEVEFVSGGLGGSGLRERDEEEEAARGRRRRQRELNRRKYQALGRRCREIEQVGECGFPFRGPLAIITSPSQFLPVQMPSVFCLAECIIHSFFIDFALVMRRGRAVFSRNFPARPDQLAVASQAPVLLLTQHKSELTFFRSLVPDTSHFSLLSILPLVSSWILLLSIPIASAPDSGSLG